ncbi:MAG TPA: hypothetical protein VGR32_10125 [Brevundimonas sp.]|jgi:hypothetical protein|uniref:hypothetical protein n=1 Tax=Brevundimonas sp. TaxID=1871086 RepID=UPI002DE3B347|nr:hypothetical protein [Brevundimonas sp.]
MSDIRDNLNRRREALLPRVPLAEAHLTGAQPGSVAFDEAQQLIKELREIESILATMQLADAQREVASAQRQTADAQRKANEQASERQSQGEEINFWLRRFLLNLTVGNVAGLFAALLFITRADAPLMPVSSVRQAVVWFLIGSVIGALFPLARAGEAWVKQNWTFGTTAAAGLQAFCLAFGTYTVITTGLDHYQGRSAEDDASRSPAAASATLSHRPQSTA